MELSDLEKAEKAQEAIQNLAEQFGPNDLCKEAWFDVLLELIYDEPIGDDLPVSGSTGQENNRTSGNIGPGEMPTYEIE